MHTLRIIRLRRGSWISLDTMWTNLTILKICLVNVLFSHSVMSDSLWPHGLQHLRPPYPSPSPGVYSNFCQLGRWCPPTISSCVALFSCCPQSFPASGYFPMSWLFPSGGQSIGASASASVLPVNIHGWFPLGLTGLIFLHSKGLSRCNSAGYITIT